MFYYTYVLLSGKDNKFYIGYTNNLRKRLEEHQRGIVESTAFRHLLKLIYYEACLKAQDASKREKYFKTGFGRRFLKNRLKAFLGEVLIEAQVRHPSGEQQLVKDNPGSRWRAGPSG